MEKQLEIKCADGSRALLKAGTERVTATAKCFVLNRKIWEFVFPFTADEAVAEEILKIAADEVKDAACVKDLAVLLKYNAEKALGGYFREREPSTVSTPAGARKALSPKEFQTMESVVKSYARVLERVGQETLEKYQAGFYPISHLPYPKEKIRSALKLAIEHTTDPKMSENLKGCEKFLDHFIDDTLARKRNAKAKEEGTGGTGASS